MATKKKLLQAAAGSAGGAGGLNVEDVFSTYLYEGNGESQSIDNGINLGQSNDGGSAHFKPDDSNDTDVISLSSANYITSGDFTIECFVWIEGLNSTNTSGYEIPTIFYFNSPRLSLTYDFVSPGGSADQAFNLFDTTYRFGSTNQHPEATYTNTWVHVAVVRNSGTIRCYVDGTEAFNFSNTTDYSGATLTIGNNSNGTPVQGHISNFRVVDGTAVYTSSFTPPTSELTAVSGTTLLTFTSENTLTDTSSSSHDFTITGSVSASDFGPFDAADTGEGGLVWIKKRADTKHILMDSERGLSDGFISTNLTNSTTASSTQITSLNSNGFSLGNNTDVNQATSGYNKFASWTFRKAPKFFDVVTYTGNGTAGRTVSHNLGSVPGCIIVKEYGASGEQWSVYHRGIGETQNIYLSLNFAASSSINHWNNTAPTDSVFTLGDEAGVNGNGKSFVAYLFAHNDGDGEFGPDGDADIIKCGSFTGNGSSTGPEIDLGFEPQWVLVKCATQGGSSPAYEWYLMDTMRGMTGEDDTWITVNSSIAESSATYNYVKPEPTGFKIQSGQSRVNASGETYIYIAIRRGPMAVPESGTEVFQPHIYTGNGSKLIYDLSITPDMVINMNRTIAGDANAINDRLRGSGQEMYTDGSGSEYNATTAGMEFDYTNQIEVQEYRRTNGQNYLNLCWKRAPSFCDIVAYTGNGTAGRTVSHNLGVAPEMIWVKHRASSVNWNVYHKDLDATNPSHKYLMLNSTDGVADNVNRWNDTEPTESVFSVGTSGGTNVSAGTYIAYLFASLDGVSKVGSYTGDGGSTQTIDCGFSSGARFVIVKPSSYADEWHVWDSERGIVASAADKRLELNTADAEDGADDHIDPHSSGFIIKSPFNTSGETYIFYAIA